MPIRSVRGNTELAAMLPSFRLFQTDHVFAVFCKVCIVMPAPPEGRAVPAPFLPVDFALVPQVAPVVGFDDRLIFRHATFHSAEQVEYSESRKLARAQRFQDAGG